MGPGTVVVSCYDNYYLSVYESSGHGPNCPGVAASAEAPSRGVRGSASGQRRHQLRSRFRRGGFSALARQEQLELLLMLAIPRGDAGVQADNLLATFGSLRRVLDAPPEELQQVAGLTASGATILRIIRDTATLYLQQEAESAPYLDSPDLLERFWRSRLGGVDHEIFEVALLDARLRLLRDGIQTLQHGTVDRAMVYPRMVVEAALRRGASAIVIAHNHPAGDPSPSQHDIYLTQAVSLAAATVQIRLVDHLVISSDAAFSMRAADLL